MPKHVKNYGVIDRKKCKNNAKKMFWKDFWNICWSWPAAFHPHRFGGEGVLIGVQTATLNAQSQFVNIAVAISALAGVAPKTISHRDLVLVVFAIFFDNFWVSELKTVSKWNVGSFGRRK